MKTITKMRIGLGLVGLFLFAPALQAQTPLAAVTDTAITQTAIDNATGDLYVGATATAADQKIVVKVAFPGSNDTTLTPTTYLLSVANTDAVNALAVSRAGDSSRICFNLSVGTNINRIRCYDGTTTGIMAAAATDNANAAGVVAALATNKAAASTDPAYVFAAVGNTGGAWLANADSVLSAHAINATTLIPAASAGGTTRINVTNAVGANVFSIANTAAFGTAPKLVFDEVFSKLYVMNNLGTAAGAGGDGVRSLAIANVTLADGTLALVGIKGTPLANWGSGAGGANKHIVGVIAANAVLSVHNFGIMHTSTGFSYLIVNGGNGAAAATGNQVWALPLVTKGFTNEGTLADVTSPMFNTQADAAASLYNATHTPATVGNGVAPWEIDSLPNCMQIIGDCVYLSQNTAADNDNQGGVVYSQAIFGQEGKIIRWTRWTRALPFNMGTLAGAGTNAAPYTNTRVTKFAFDARSGRGWSVPHTANTSVMLQTWEDAANVATNLNLNAGGGVYCSYHLNRASVNFGNAAIGRYSVFGGDETVVFTRMASTAADPAGNYTAIDRDYYDDFTEAENILATALPAGAGEVRCLGYSHWAADGATRGFFFAGTDAGLYAYGAVAAGVGGNGLDMSAADELNAGVLNWALPNAAWFNIANVVGSVRKIKSIGNRVYILVRDNSGTTTVDRLYSVAATTTLALVNTGIQTIAVTNTGNLADVDAIYDFEIVQWTTGTPTSAGGIAADQEQVVLATNLGLYQSRAVGGLQAATTQALALWTFTTPVPVNGLYAQSNLENVTTLTAQVIANAAGAPNTYMRSSLVQLLSVGPDLTANPLNDFNANSVTSFTTLDRLTDYWSDGGRRFFVYTAEDGSSTFASLPYDVSTYNMTTQYGTSNEIAGKTLHSLGLMANGYLTAIGGSDEAVIM